MHYILHVGATKTGSTALQKFLACNGDELIRHGALYPAGFQHESQHSWLIAFLKQDVDFVRWFAADCRATAERNGVQKIIISGEAISVAPPGRLRQLKGVLEEQGGATSFQVIVYFRNILRRLLARAAQQMKIMLLDEEGIRETMAKTSQPAVQIRNLEAVFGEGDVDVRLLEHAKDLYADFLEAADVPWSKAYQPTPRLNTTEDPIMAQLFSALRVEFGWPEAAMMLQQNLPKAHVLPTLENRLIDIAEPLIGKTDIDHPKLAPFRDVLLQVRRPSEAERPEMGAYLGALANTLLTLKETVETGEARYLDKWM